MKDANGQILQESDGRNWCRKANINGVCDRRIPVLGVREAVNEIKSGKSPGLDSFPQEYLKKCGITVFEWLVRLFNECFGVWAVLKDWRGACVVSQYKGKVDKYECSNSSGISLQSVVGKLYGRVLIK